MPNKQLVTAVIVNFNTAELTRRAATSFRKHYPIVPLLLIDNGSHDGSAGVLNELRAQDPRYTDVILNKKNIHHGPAMDQGLRTLNTPYVLFLDSDCELLRGGFLEAMTALGEEKTNNYAVGKLVFMNKRGFDVKESNGAIAYIRPICLLIKRKTYLTLPRFRRHGAPCLENMKKAVEEGLLLLDFPVFEYVTHKGRGTAEEYGYRLGLHGKINYVLNKLGL